MSHATDLCHATFLKCLHGETCCMKKLLKEYHEKDYFNAPNYILALLVFCNFLYCKFTKLTVY